MLKQNSFATWLLCFYTRSDGRRRSVRFVKWFLGYLRVGVLKFWDPVVSFEYLGRSVLVPLSHKLPFIAADFPLYGLNFAETVSDLSKAVPSLLVIDVGANVGDSVASCGVFGNVCFYCVEASPIFEPFLRANLGKREDVTTLLAVVGVPGVIIEQGGTGFLDTTGVSTVPVFQLAGLPELPTFSCSDILVKLDTDGFDAEIISKSVEFLSRNNVSIFFEFDPQLSNRSSVHSSSVYEILVGCGFTKFVFWDKYGHLMYSAEGAGAAAAFENFSIWCHSHTVHSYEQTMYLDVYARH
jgi:FkbM family methyltransferase